ncbi:MAG: amino acid permease [Bacteroidota bacterium]
MENKSNKSGLSRKLGLFTALMIVVCSMIGSGVFKKIAPMSATLMSPWLILLCWIVAGFITMFGAFTFAGFAKVNSEAGGEYQYLKISFGKFFSFLYGWTAFTVIQSASVASIAYVFGESVGNLVHLPQFPPEWSSINIFGYIFPFDNIGVKLVTISGIVIITIINYRGVQYGGFTVNLFTVAKMLGILILVVFGLNYVGGSTSNVSTVSPGYDAFSEQGWWQITSIFFVAMLSAFWAYDGWANITFLAGEVKNPYRNLPIAISFGVLVVMVIYFLIHYVYLYVMPVDSYIAINGSRNTIAAAEMANVVIGPFGFILVSLLILVSTFGTANSSAMSSSRIYYAMAREGMFFGRAGATHKKFNTPHVSLVLQCVWASILVISGTFDQLTDMLIFAAFIFYGAAAFGLLKLKSKKIITEKVWGYTVFPLLFIIFCVLITASSFFQRPLASITGIGLVLSGIPFYFFWRNKKPQS